MQDAKERVDFLIESLEASGDTIVIPTRAKLKFDRQIIAITRVQGQTTIYSDDGDIARLGAALNLEVVPVHALPSPPQDPQGSLTFESENT